MTSDNRLLNPQSREFIIWCSECGKPYDGSSIDKLEKHIYEDPDHEKAVSRRIEAEKLLHKNDDFYKLLPYGILGAVLTIVGVVVLLR